MLNRELLAGTNRVGSGSRRHVLIVEDEPLIGLDLKDCLERNGNNVMWVETDGAAYAALQANAHRFDTLILDIDLGKGTTGFDIARYARNRHPDIAIVFSSGSPPDWLNSFGVKGALFVPKPCTESALLTALDIVRERSVAGC